MGEIEQTPVEWFNQQLVDKQNGNGDSRNMDEIFEQAKEMEIQQKIKQFNTGFEEGRKQSNHIYIY